MLEDIAREISDDVWIAAPEEEQSDKGRAISLTHPIRTREVGDKAWACLLTSLVSASVIYNLRQTKRFQSLPEELAKEGRVRLYLTWFYLALFTNVVIAGTFSIWALAITTVISICVFLYSRPKITGSDKPSTDENQNAPT